MYELTRVFPPAVLPVSLDEVRRHLAIEDGSHDIYLLESIIPAAVDTFEARTNRQVLLATWRLSMELFPCGSHGIRLPLGQYQSLIEVTYLTDESDTAVDVDLDTLRVRYSPDRTVIMPPSTGWPVTSSGDVEQVDVTWLCGWSNAAAVPAGVKQTILFLCAHYFEQREPVVTTSVNPVPFALESLCQRWSLGDEFDYAYRTA